MKVCEITEKVAPRNQMLQRISAAASGARRARGRIESKRKAIGRWVTRYL